jgi:ribose transport system substrate-binding protein
MTRKISRRRAVLTAGSASGLIAAPAILRAAPARKFRIALSNSYIGNKWRIEMENVFRAALQMEPYRSEVDGSWFNSGNDVSAQTQHFTDLISRRADAIITDAASPTGLNGIIAQATRRGILVISFDNIVTSTAAVNIETNDLAFGRQGATWLTEKLGGRGNVVMVTGVPGAPVDNDNVRGANEIFSQHPEIKIVNRYSGMWDSSTAQRNTAAVLPSLPKIDGIWCNGGTDGVLKAFVAAGRIPLPPTAGEAENGFRKFMVGYMDQKVDGISIGHPPYLSVVALELARQILSGQRPRKGIPLPFPFVTTETVKVGETVFPDLPDSFYPDFTDSGPNAVVKLCVEAALGGKPCGERLEVNLPA